MTYGKKVTLTLDEQEIKDIVHLIENQDLSDKTTKFLFDPILYKLRASIEYY